MLVLTRKTSEMIQIGDEIVVKVIRTGKSTVKIGIEAPAHVRVLRAELCDEDEAEEHLPAATPKASAKVVAKAGHIAKPSASAVNLDDLGPVKAYSDQYPHVA
jgi:carbon storage regulator